MAQNLASHIVPLMAYAGELFTLYNGYLPPHIRPYTPFMIGAGGFLLGSYGMTQSFSRKRKRFNKADEECFSCDDSEHNTVKRTKLEVSCQSTLDSLQETDSVHDCFSNFHVLDRSCENLNHKNEPNKVNRLQSVESLEESDEDSSENREDTNSMNVSSGSQSEPTRLQLEHDKEEENVFSCNSYVTVKSTEEVGKADEADIRRLVHIEKEECTKAEEPIIETSEDSSEDVELKWSRADYENGNENVEEEESEGEFGSSFPQAYQKLYRGEVHELGSEFIYQPTVQTLDTLFGTDSSLKSDSAKFRESEKESNVVKTCLYSERCTHVNHEDVKSQEVSVGDRTENIPFPKLNEGRSFGFPALKSLASASSSEFLYSDYSSSDDDSKDEEVTEEDGGSDIEDQPRHALYLEEASTQRSTKFSMEAPFEPSNESHVPTIEKSVEVSLRGSTDDTSLNGFYVFGGRDSVHRCTHSPSFSSDGCCYDCLDEICQKAERRPCLDSKLSHGQSALYKQSC